MHFISLYQALPRLPKHPLKGAILPTLHCSELLHWTWIVIGWKSSDRNVIHGTSGLRECIERQRPVFSGWSRCHVCTLTLCAFTVHQLCVYCRHGPSLSMSIQFQCSDGCGGESHIWALLLIEHSTGPRGLPRWRFLNPWLFNAGCAWVIKQIIFN